MNLSEYKKILNNNNIILFDPEYRISFHRLNQILLNTVQTGSGINPVQNNKINNFKNIKTNILKRLVKSLISNKKQEAQLYIDIFL